MSGLALFACGCSNWSVGDDLTSGYGINTAGGQLWSLAGSATCSTPGHLYCFEQTP